MENIENTTNVTENVTKRHRLSDEERAQRDALKATDRAAKAAARSAKREAKEKERQERVPHLKKVAKAAHALAPLPEHLKEVFDKLTSDCTPGDVTLLVAHLNLHQRIEQTVLSKGSKPAEGCTVQIIAGDPRYVGQVGVVTKVQQIRCYVKLDSGKEVYLFNADVKQV